MQPMARVGIGDWFSSEFPMSHRQQINAAAAAIATSDGWSFPAGLDFVGLLETPEKNLSQALSAYKHRARALHFLALAEVAFEAITGDRPDYAADEEENA